MENYEMLQKKKAAVESQIKRVCDLKEKADLIFLQAELEQIELQILDEEDDEPESRSSVQPPKI